MTTGFTRACSAALMTSAIALVVPAQADEAATTYRFDQPAQNLGSALRVVATRAGTELYVSATDLEGLQAPALNGNMTVQRAIALLLQGSGLEAEFERNSIIIRRSAPAATSESNAASETIVVTGTHIRGASVTSPVISVGRDDIERAGQRDLGEVARSIPQNFTGGQNPGVGNGAGLINTNLNSASHLNLRGLGPDATLTLLNGRRLPYDGAFGGVDISAIPVAAVERIEIMPDGASAQYGSDAVAGVANVILRRDFDGLVTSARLGTATSGGYFQQGVDATAGGRWGSGGVMLSYQFAKNSAVFGRQRDFAASLPDGNSIYPRVRQHSLLLTGQQEISEDITFRIDGLYNRRNSLTIGGSRAAAGITRTIFAPKSESFSIAPELEAELGGDWRARASLAFGRDKARYDTLITPPGGIGRRTSGCYCNDALSAELILDGKLLALPGGDVRAAFGGGYRSNGMDYSRLNDGVVVGSFDVRQDSHYLFGEVELPLFSPAQELPLLRRLTVTAAARYENYPGMGKVTTPKFGLIYEPDPNVSFKASWGRSFKAPSLYQQYVGYETYLLNASDYGLAPTGTVFYTSGGNPELKPERARSWSVGIGIHPPALDGLRIDANYFNVRYRDRVAQPVSGSIGSALSNPGYASLLDRDPSATALDDLVGGSLYGLTNFSDEAYDPASVVVLIDNRNRNLARQDIEGVDLAMRYGIELGAGQRFDLQGSATYLKSDQLITAALPRTELAGQLYNPPHWRGRAGATFTGNAFMLSAYMNYVGGVEDRRFADPVEIGSLTSVDLSARIDVGQTATAAPLFNLSIVINNLFNAKPARIRPLGSSDTPYDSTNFSPIGRVVGLKISRSW